ncbi:MAG: hypothetical protein H6553_11415 [Chitinophagales bacterium]|nr:hypothetical protein [Chitinophagales bacterium]
MKNLFYLLAFLMIVSCSNYGEKIVVDKTEIYYKDGVTKEQAETLGKYLQKAEFTDDNEKSVQLTKNADNNHLIFRMVVDEAYANDKQYDAMYKSFARNLSAALNQPVDFEICDNSFTTLKTFKADDISKLVNVGNTELLYTKNISEEELNSMIAHLEESNKSEDVPMTIELDKQNDTIIYRMVVKESYLNDASYEAIFKNYGTLLSREVFNGTPLQAEMCNDMMQTVKVVR